MIVQYYKPNSKNTGCAFSFDIGANNKNQEPCVYVRAIKQHSWNDKTRTGSFSENAKDPDKSISIKLNEIEVGGFIHATLTRIIKHLFLLNLIKRKMGLKLFHLELLEILPTSLALESKCRKLTGSRNFLNSTCKNFTFTDFLRIKSLETHEKENGFNTL